MTEEEFLKTDEKEEENHYRIFVAFAIISIIKYYFHDEKMIGGDYRYSIYILLLPIIIGLIILVIYQRKRLFFVLVSKDSFLHKILYFLFVLMAGVIFSFISTYTISDFVFQTINKEKIKNSDLTTLELDIYTANEKKGTNSKNLIWFKYKGKATSLKTSSDIVKLVKKDLKKYYINLKIRKGIWNHFVIENWSLVERKH